jgi:hypothetical protein
LMGQGTGPAWRIGRVPKSVRKEAIVSLRPKVTMLSCFLNTWNIPV